MMKYLDGQVAVSFISVSTVEGNKVTTGVWGGGEGGVGGRGLKQFLQLYPSRLSRSDRYKYDSVRKTRRVAATFASKAHVQQQSEGPVDSEKKKIF